MNFFKSRGFLIVITALVVGTAVYLIMQRPAPPPPPPPLIPKTDPLNCITLDQDIIVNSWLGGGWNSPGNANFIPSIMFVPSDAGGGRIRVEAYPVDDNCQPLPTKKVSMTIQSNCVFPSGLVLDTVRYDFTALDVDAFGDLIHFDFLRLVARPDSTDPSKLGFGVNFVKSKGTVEVPSYRGVTKPCPPFCPQAR